MKLCRVCQYELGVDTIPIKFLSKEQALAESEAIDACKIHGKKPIKRDQSGFPL